MDDTVWEKETRERLNGVARYFKGGELEIICSFIKTVKKTTPEAEDVKDERDREQLGKIFENIGKLLAYDD